jgi:hypothetical protein
LEIEMKESTFKSKAVLFAIATLALLLPGVAFSQSISGAAVDQINDILAEKRKFTSAQSKMHSSLVFAAKLARGELAGKSFAGIVEMPETDADGLVVVDIRGTASDLVAQVTAQGGQVVSQFPAYGAVRARMPLRNIEALAGSLSVTSVSPQEKARTNVGALTSQAYISHGADQVITGLGINGSGIKVGVLSDSATAAGVAALIASGDLGPNTTVLPGQAGSSTGTNEGTAMMEIVQDLAPGAQLFFATAFNGVASFASNILSLAAAGCTIIVDDVSYFNEGAFQDGPIAQAVNTFVAEGGMYFSSAANSGNLTLGTSGTWEGDFVDGGTSPLEGGKLHSFGTQTYDALETSLQGFGPVSLKWSDPLGASSNDYDLFILNSSGNGVKGFSVSSQTGSQDPYEQINPSGTCGTAKPSGWCPTAGDRIVVVQFSGAVRALRLDTNRGQLSIGTAGSTYGHNGGATTISVAATYWDSAKNGVNPFTGIANPVETFSSDGPRRIFYNPNGTAITPGAVTFGTNGGTLLQKPDLTAADGVAAHTPSFFPFFGTSAAAPHAAAIAALVWSAKPSLTNIQVKNILLNTALPTMGPAWNRDGGFGIVMALKAVQAARQ